MLLLGLEACQNQEEDKLILLANEDLVVELGSDLDLSLDKYIDVSNLSEEELAETTIKLVIPKMDANGNVRSDSKELDPSKLDFGSKAILITLNDEQEVIDVIVQDTIAPEFTKTKDSYTIEEGDDLPDIKQDFEATDLSDVSISINTDDVDTDKAGEYKATVTASDTSGNEVKHEVTITVEEKPKETVSTPNAGQSGGSTTTSKPSGSGSSNNKPSSGSGSSGSSSTGGSSKPEEPSAYHVQSYAQSVFALVNEERAKAGLEALNWDPSLASTANIRAEEIALYYSHDRPDGSSCFTAFPQNLMYMGENIAMGQTSPSWVMTDWMNSSGHRENILSPHYSIIAVGCYYSDGTYHWVQVFGG